MNRISFAFIFAILTVSFVATASELTAPANAFAGDRYDRLFPKYAGVCVGGQRKKLGEEFEKNWGHVVLYLNGACRDKSVKHPRIKKCPVDSPNGVIISVNSLFKNANWAAFEGRELAFFGRLKKDQVLDQSHFDSVVNEIISSGALDGIEFHTDEFKEKDADPVRYTAIRAVDTDLALTFGRNVNCVKLPVTEKQLDKAIAFLNRRNEQLAKKEVRPYKWHYFYNNCGHLTHNTLAELGIWESKSVDRSWITQLFNLSLPANEFLDLARMANEGSLEPAHIQSNPRLRRLVVEEGWLPIRHGVLVEAFAHHQPNKMYEGNLGLFILDFPFGSKRDAFDSFLSTARYHDLKTNLEHFKTVYEKALNSLTSFKDDQVFVEKYRQYLNNQVLDVQRLQSSL